MSRVPKNGSVSGQSLLQDALRRLRRNRMAMLGAYVTGSLI